MITDTLIQGLTQQMVQARVDSIDVRPFQFATHFPVVESFDFSWKTLENQVWHKNVAADVHSDNSSAIRKSRPIFESARGDIPYLSILRTMDRSDLKKYQTALALSRDRDAAKLVQYWAGDVDFCFNGVQSELEYIAWNLASNAGKLEFTTTTNATFANEFNLDYQVDESMKVKSSVDWSDKSNADIIGDLVKIVELADSKGLDPRYAFVNKKLLYKICSSEQIIKACASPLVNVAKMAQTPTLEQVNAMLSSQAFLNGLQLCVIDQKITREFKDGTMQTGNPFEDDRLVLSQTPKLGTTQYSMLDESNDAGIAVKRKHTTVKKYGQPNPKVEFTLGEADAIPVLDTAYHNVYLRTDGQDW